MRRLLPVMLLLLTSASRRVREICESGATVLFVSHSEGLIADLCDEAIWIDNGQLVLRGDAEPVTKAYRHWVWERELKRNEEANQQKEASYKRTAETGRYWMRELEPVRITKVAILDVDNNLTGGVTNGETLRIAVEWEGTTIEEKIYCGYRIDSDRLPGRFLASMPINLAFILMTAVRCRDGVGLFIQSPKRNSEKGVITLACHYAVSCCQRDARHICTILRRRRCFPFSALSNIQSVLCTNPKF